MFVGHFICLNKRCKYVWHQQVGPTNCPKCQNLYLTWKNYPVEKPMRCEICEIGFEKK